MADDPRESLSLPVKPGAILVIDDDESLRLLVTRRLAKAGFACVEARDGEEGLERAASMAGEIDAIVCDVMMPGIDGFAVLARLKSEPLTASIPVILLTAHANTEADVVRGVEAGAVDHLIKPFSGPVLVAKLKAVVARGRSERMLRKKLAFAEQHATVDALTELFNRRQFERRFKQESAHARRHRRPLAIVLFDLDRFKEINDTFGHEEGDRVLRHVAQAARSVLRAEDSAFRYGGEEFVLLLRDCDAAQAASVGARLREALARHPIALGKGESRTITFSGGVAAAQESNDFALEELVSRADKALYRAKRGGRDRLELA